MPNSLPGLKGEMELGFAHFRLWNREKGQFASFLWLSGRKEDTASVIKLLTHSQNEFLTTQERGLLGGEQKPSVRPSPSLSSPGVVPDFE